MSYTQRGDRPRVMTPLDLVVATAKAKTALWAYVGIARHADNRTGRSSCTVEQVAETVGISRSQASVGINWLIRNRWVTRLVEGRRGAGSSLYVVHMEPARGVQHPESRTLDPGSGEPDAGDLPATDFPDAEPVSASGKSVADERPAIGNPDAETSPASGKPDSSVRKVGRSLVSSLVTTTYSPNASGDSGHPNHPDDGTLLPGLEAPEPKTKRKATTYPEDFMRLWQAAPRRRGTERGSKPDALREWQRALARGVDTDTLIAAANAYGRATDPRYVPDLCRWLKGELYEPYLEQIQRTTVGEPSDEDLDAVLGKALITLPAPPPGVHPGTADYAAWKAGFFQTFRADRVRQYRERVNTTRSIA